jgi:hemerythrin-like domain-containing protein
MDTTSESNRRQWMQSTLAGVTLLGAGLTIAGCASTQGGDAGSKAASPDANGGPEDVSPAEDLMREHGVLKRVLLVYVESKRRLDANQDVQPEALADAAGVIRSFIEAYHEKLEEDFLFPRFRKANKLVDLVDVLQAQHGAGRKLTETTLQLSNASTLRDAGERLRLAGVLQLFVRMYEPHEAREDTVLFPAFRTIVSAHEYDALGDDFERKEHELFGEDGFERMVDKVAGIEKKLGIYELSQFTPKV